MQRWTSLALAGVLAAALCAALGAGCGDDKEDEKDETCAFSTADATAIAFTADCSDPTGEGAAVTVEAVAGTAEEVADGAAFKVDGQFEFAVIDHGRIELALDCPGEDAYQTCDHSFKRTKRGSYTARAAVAGCAGGAHPTELIVRVWDPARGTNWPLCVIHLGASPDDDTAGADDDSAADGTGGD